jgi:D-tyrosyl-tRNA(Tyr) deacylase
VLQRVKSASVTVDGQLISSIGKGILVLAAVSRDDTEKDVETMATKILKTKLWDDDSTDPPGRWKHNVKEIDGEVLCGAFVTLLIHPLTIFNTTTTLTQKSSLPVHAACNHEERK